jgi:O-antigen/teichoic acid export membrane protein
MNQTSAEKTGIGNFVKKTTITLISSFLNLLLGIGISIILARVLGPDGRGIYIMATLLPSLIVTFGNLGIGPATVYYVARGEFRRQEILGNNVLLSLGIGGLGVLVGVFVVLFFHETVFPGVSSGYLLLALALVPVEFFFSYVNYMLLGAQRIKEFNYVQIAQSGLFLGAIALALLGLKAGVTGAIIAGLFTWVIVDAIVFRLALRIAGGIDLKPNTSYIKRATSYGVSLRGDSVEVHSG